MEAKPYAQDVCQSKQSNSEQSSPGPETMENIGDVNNNLVYTLHTEHTPDQQSHTTRPCSETESGGPEEKQNLPTSFKGLFSNQASAAEPESDLEVYRQSYLQAEGHKLDRNEQFVNNQGDLQQVNTEQYQNQTVQQFPNAPVQMTSNQQEQFSVTEFHQFHVDSKDQYENQGNLASDQQYYQHTTGRADSIEYQVDMNGQYLSPAELRRGFSDDQHIAAEELATELVKTYGGQNSHM